MTIKIVKCDICGRDKGEANHWYMAMIPSEVFEWVAIYSHTSHPNFDALLGGMVDLCSRECVSKFTNRVMDGWGCKQ